jgi:CheY-like chemotaxis protein
MLNAGRPTACDFEALMSIIVIDDDPQIVNFLTRLIGRMRPDCTVYAASDGLRGVQLALQHRATVQLIVLDARMPRIDGQLVAAFLRCTCPTVPILPLSGDSRTYSTFAALSCLPCLPKGDAAEIYQHALMQAMETPFPAPTITPLHRAMAEQVAQIIVAEAGDHVVVERQTLQRLTTSLEEVVRRIEPHRDLSRSMKELRRLI